MSTAAIIFVALVAVAHVWFFVLEAILWTAPLGRKIFGLSREKAEITAALAQNQGVYNLFLSAGLVWSLLVDDPLWAHNIAMFFLACVVVAAVVGALTVSWRILIVQGLPAAAGLVLLWF